MKKYKIGSIVLMILMMILLCLVAFKSKGQNIQSVKNTITKESIIKLSNSNKLHCDTTWRSPLSDWESAELFILENSQIEHKEIGTYDRPAKTDTIPALLMISDTCIKVYYYGEKTGFLIYSIKGYVVFDYTNIIFHYYLDIYKQPLKENEIVFDWIELKNK